ncbi:PASTA domain-containing protein [Micromonospora zingiberis]|uniref:PASTA domain-containing protein n=1 Tax=Micromonospora zingiberis TaxID=2053011 RepID=A0A4R0GBW9_9ACTN|nr:PASTA domain-containing protein [Micromonospora zingiberis]TCB93553.1 PASTA domain-containing protein [Micromonospora zingiberis]
MSERSERGEEQPDDQTRPLPPAAGDPDETAPLGGTPESRGADATMPVPPAQRSEPAPWSGRAEVPSLRPGADRELAGGEWYGDEPAGRAWWLPIVWGIVVLLLIGLLGVGLWLARQAVDSDGGTPPSPQPTSAAPTSASAAPTRSPSAAPTTSAAPTALPMPPLVGLSEGAARAMLDQLDLDHRVQYRPSDQRAGTVIATDPAAGDPVQAGDVVTLVVATASPSPSPTTAEPTASEPTVDPTTTASPTTG